MKAGTGFTLLQGSAVAVQGNNGSILLEAGSYLHLDAGSAILSGARSDFVDGSPVYTATGTGTTLTLRSGGEMTLDGSITANGTVTLDAGQNGSDRADYFDTLDGRTLSQTADPDTIAALLANLTALAQGSTGTIDTAPADAGGAGPGEPGRHRHGALDRQLPALVGAVGGSQSTGRADAGLHRLPGRRFPQRRCARRALRRATGRRRQQHRLHPVHADDLLQGRRARRPAAGVRLHPRHLGRLQQRAGRLGRPGAPPRRRRAPTSLRCPRCRKAGRRAIAGLRARLRERRHRLGRVRHHPAGERAHLRATERGAASRPLPPRWTSPRPAR